MTSEITALHWWAVIVMVYGAEVTAPHLKGSAA
jgi:hypothetical protein